MLGDCTRRLHDNDDNDDDNHAAAAERQHGRHDEYEPDRADAE